MIIKKKKKLKPYYGRRGNDIADGREHTRNPIATPPEPVLLG